MIKNRDSSSNRRIPACACDVVKNLQSKHQLYKGYIISHTLGNILSSPKDFVPEPYKVDMSVGRNDAGDA
jgi:hypothetical protein